MSYAAYRSRTINKLMNHWNFDLWREIKYYEYVREKILKKKISPNFINLILYKVDTESKLNWLKLNSLIYKSDPNSVLRKFNEAEFNHINEKHNIKSMTGLISYLKTKEITEEAKKNAEKKIMWNKTLKQKNGYPVYEKYAYEQYADKHLSFYYKRNPDNNKKLNVIRFDNKKKAYFLYDEKIQKFRMITNKVFLDNSWIKCDSLNQCLEKEDLTVDSGKSLIALTEAPTHNILEWCSPVYVEHGSIKKMLSTGYHDEKVWRSVLFQFVYTCAVLQKHEILFNRMSLENNFFIKDIYSPAENRGHWIYNIDGIDYYVPNYGYILVFDSKYIDANKINSRLLDASSSPNSDEETNVRYKILSTKIFKWDQNGDLTGVNETATKNAFIDHSYNDFISMLQTDNFTAPLNKRGGLKPPESIMNLIDNLNKTNDGTGKNIINKIFKYFKNYYLHNRVGDYLTKGEKEYLSLTSRPTFRKGGLLIHEERFREYKWVIFLRDDPVLNNINKRS